MEALLRRAKGMRADAVIGVRMRYGKPGERPIASGQAVRWIREK